MHLPLARVHADSNGDKEDPEGQLHFFFHEFGRRVGMVPRSSLKKGKYNQMEKRTKKTPNTKQTKQPRTRAHRQGLHHLVVLVFPLC